MAPRNEAKRQVPKPDARTEADATGKRVCWRRPRAVKVGPGSRSPEVSEEASRGKQEKTEGDGSRLSCGRLAPRRKAVGRKSVPVRGTRLRFP